MQCKYCVCVLCWGAKVETFYMELEPEPETVKNYWRAGAGARAVKPYLVLAGARAGKKPPKNGF